MGKINQSTAISNAESAALRWYNSNKTKIDDGTYTGVLNTGDDDDWVDSTLQETIRNAWLHKGAWHGLDRRASFSSGEAKFDLKFAIHGKTNSCFNYHVPFKVDNSAEIARKEQAAKDKKHAEEFKAKQEEEAKEKKRLADLKLKAENELKERLKTLTPLANAAWNKLGDKEKKNLKVTEAVWKKNWIDEKLKQKK